LRSICGGSKIGGCARQPGGDDPGSWKALRGFPQAERDRNPQRKTWGKDGQPGVFLAQQRARELCCPGQPDSEVIAEPPQLVVPTSGSETQRVLRQVRVLVEQYFADQFRSDVVLWAPHRDQQYEEGTVNSAWVCLRSWTVDRPLALSRPAGA